MVYDPSVPNSREKTRFYIAVWIAILGSGLMLRAKTSGALEALWGLGCALFAGPALGLFFASRFDDYFLALRNAGFAWAMAVVAGWIAAHGALFIGNTAFAAGSALSGGVTLITEPRYSLPPLFDDARWLATFAAAAFGSGFLVRHLRPGP